MTGPTPYRELAGTVLGYAAQELNAIPSGATDAGQAAFHISKAQALATVAVAQALLEIGDVLRSMGADG